MRRPKKRELLGNDLMSEYLQKPAEGGEAGQLHLEPDVSSLEELKVFFKVELQIIGADLNEVK